MPEKNDSNYLMMGKFWYFKYLSHPETAEKGLGLCSFTLVWTGCVLNQKGAAQALLIIRFSNYSTPSEECATRGCVCSLFQQLLSRSGLHWTLGPWAGCAAGQSPLLPCCLRRARWWTASQDPSCAGDKGNWTTQFKTTEGKEASVVNKMQHKKGGLWTVRLFFGRATNIGREKSRMQTEGFTWRALNSSPCKWMFVQSFFCPQWTSHCWSLDWQSLWVAPHSLSAQIVPTWLLF